MHSVRTALSKTASRPEQSAGESRSNAGNTEVTDGKRNDVCQNNGRNKTLVSLVSCICVSVFGVLSAHGTLSTLTHTS